METKERSKTDDIKQEKNDNKNPMNAPENHISMQEYHHARHALYFLYFGTYSVINNKTAWCTHEKIERVLVHLNCLKEFILADTILENSVKTILWQLSQFKPCDHKEWGWFLFHSWACIHQIAVHYGEAQKCFPDSYYQSLKKIVGIHG